MTILRPIPPLRPALTALATIVLLAACTGGVAGPVPASPSAGAGTPSAPAPTAVPVPSASAADGASGEPGTGGGADPNPGTGESPIPVDPGIGGGTGAGPAPTIVAPVAGVTGIHTVSAQHLQTAVNGRNLAVRVAWWSGVAPCTVLAGVNVVRDGDAFTLTVREGSAAPSETMCIEIAQYKATIVDLGELDPGTYTVTAFGDAPPVTVTIDG